MRTDIINIQLSFNEKIFNKLIELFQKKWLGDDCKDFVEYFLKNWVNNNSGWYEGYCIGYPSTSNGIESSHKDIKKDTNYCRKPAIKFIQSTGKTLVEEWSKARNALINGVLTNPNCKVYEEKPIIEKFCQSRLQHPNSSQKKERSARKNSCSII